MNCEPGSLMGALHLNRDEEWGSDNEHDCASSSSTTPKGFNRHLYKYAGSQKRHTDSLLADSRYGFVPLAPETFKSDERLGSRCSG